MPHKTYSKNRTLSIEAHGYLIPIPAPVNYIGVRKDLEVDSKGVLQSLTLTFLPVKAEMKNVAPYDIEEYLKKKGYELVSADVPLSGWKQYLPDARDDDPPAKQIVMKRGERGFVWVLPEAALFERLFKIMSRQGDSDAWDALPNVAKA